jgi:hypothetical protein
MHVYKVTKGNWAGENIYTCFIDGVKALGGATLSGAKAI